MHFQTCVHKEIESNKTVPIISFFLYLANIVRTVYAIIICCICMYMYLSKFKTEVVFNTIIKDAFVCTYSKWSWPKVYVTYTLRLSFQNCLLWLLFGGGEYNEISDSQCIRWYISCTTWCHAFSYQTLCLFSK